MTNTKLLKEYKENNYPPSFPCFGKLDKLFKKELADIDTLPALRLDTGLVNVIDRWCHWLLTHSTSPISSETGVRNILVQAVARMYDERLNHTNPHIEMWEAFSKTVDIGLHIQETKPEFLLNRCAGLGYLHLENMYFPQNSLTLDIDYDRNNAISDMAHAATAFFAYPIEKATGKTEPGERLKAWKRLHDKLNYMIALHHFDLNYQNQYNANSDKQESNPNQPCRPPK